MSFGTRKRKIKNDEPVIVQPPAPETLVGYWRDESCEIASHFGYAGSETPVRKIGHPPLLGNPDLVAAIFASVAAGSSPSDAAQQVKISPSNFTTWVERGVTGDDGYLQFLDTLNKAISLSKKWHTDNIRKVAADGVWTASAWWLERNFPEQFSPRSMLDVTHTHRAGLKAPQITVIPFGTDDARKLMLMLQGSGPDDGAIDADFTEVAG